MEKLIEIAYIVASVLFIFGIKMLGSADTARRGNQISAVGMLIAVVATLLYKEVLEFTWIVGGLAIGTAVGAIWAKRVQMTGMPELVALFNGFGGLGSLLVGWAEFEFHKQTDLVTQSAIFFAILIGGVTFTGSLIAYLKLSGKMSGSPTLFAGQKAINALLFAALLVLGGLYIFQGTAWALYAVIGLSLVLGVLGVLPIGGGDMPVIIAFLNSFSGLAASAAGFVILNNVLIVAGCLVGASGIILTVIMCKAMNRTLGNVLFGGFGAATGKSGAAVEGEMKALSVEDAFYVLEAAENVVFVPGYGMAVAQAQHAVKELGQILEKNGAEVRYAIHPVAGRMPGHMNVLLAEADVPYEQLCEMDAVNPTMASVDVAIVIGANDVVNPAAAEDPTSPIYGMPIINVHEARTVFALKRGQGAGFSGLVNTLFFRENCRMIYGDAKETITALAAQFKD
ncbi:MAG: NAD(P)(+) transhydrogenase (Re/Si-specific) subunit beta [Akkermansiaceae bacterium]|nr:NAD(P)(+) transhydrogenase (Re/Si-specific) subunit beta [Akkermansiaceae bacterium]